MKFLFVFLLFVIYSCNNASLPRVVKNGCGTYAVQIKSFGKDYYYIGLPKYKPHYECYINGGDSGIIYSASGWYVASSGTIGYTFDNDCGWDTTNIELVKKHKHEYLWSNVKDTGYTYTIGYELQFQTVKEATAAMNSYLYRTNEYKRFCDSIEVCHTYK